MLMGVVNLGCLENRQTHARRHVIITYFVPQGGTPFLVKSNAPVEQWRSQGFKLGDWVGSVISGISRALGIADNFFLI